jgi:Toxin PAAR-like domain
MGCTVFANKNGLFHKGSDGKGRAFPDICLSPPPPPAGPVPVPYLNQAVASDLAGGSTTVMVEGNPTALKDQSYTSTSSGDEGGTQGGGLITHKTKGKAYFKFWSLDVMVEGLNADGHSDPMAQNCGSSPLNGLCWRSSVVREMFYLAESSTCTKAYDSKKHHKRPNTAQTQQAQAEHASNGGTCWECGSSTPAPSCPATHVDHQPPLVVQWYAGGCFLSPADWEQQCLNTRCKPHCAGCSHDQSTDMANFNTDMITNLNL